VNSEFTGCPVSYHHEGVGGGYTVRVGDLEFELYDQPKPLRVAEVSHAVDI